MNLSVDTLCAVFAFFGFSMGFLFTVITMSVYDLFNVLIGLIKSKKKSIK